MLSSTTKASSDKDNLITVNVSSASIVGVYESNDGAGTRVLLLFTDNNSITDRALVLLLACIVVEEMVVVYLDFCSTVNVKLPEKKQKYKNVNLIFQLFKCIQYFSIFYTMN